MAKITTSFPFSPIICPVSSTKTKSSSLPLSSSESKAFGHVLPNLNSSISFLPSSGLLYRVCVYVSARYGGVPRSSGPGDPRRSDEGQAFDISSIRSDTVRLIDAQQNMVGVVSKDEAIKMAEDAELDLVILSSDADPPVLRIMDYNKYRYELQKKKKEQQKKSAASRMDLKELKMGYNIDQHDYSVRLKAARKFLKDGDKVKVIVNLKGRENEFRNIAIELITRFQYDIGETIHGRWVELEDMLYTFKEIMQRLATEEARNFRDRNIFIVLVPNKAVIQKAQEPSKRKDKSLENEVSAEV